MTAVSSRLRLKERQAAALSEQAMAGFAEFDARELAAVDALKESYVEFEGLVQALTMIHAERARYGSEFRFNDVAQADEFRHRSALSTRSSVSGRSRGRPSWQSRTSSRTRTPISSLCRSCRNAGRTTWPAGGRAASSTRGRTLST